MGVTLRSLQFALLGLVVGLSASPGLAQEKARRPSRQKPAPDKSVALSTKQIVDRVRQSLVVIETASSDGTPVSIGSGFVFGSPSRIVTNLHVLKWAHTASFKTLSDGVHHKVTLVWGINLERDYCLLEGENLSVPGLHLASSGSVSVGDPVIVAGNPKGLEATFSSGIVSALRKSPDLVQIDAPISPGSSGGPVVNNKAEVIGIAVSSLRDGQNLNFAVPLYDKLKVYALEYSVRDAAALSVNDVDVLHLKGRPRSIEDRRVDISVDPRTRRYVEGRSITLDSYWFNEDGMIIEHTLGKSVHEKKEYWEVSILKTWWSQMNDKVSTSEYSLSQGAARRTGAVHFGETVIAGDQDAPAKRLRGDLTGAYLSFTYDRFGDEIAQEAWHVSKGDDKIDNRLRRTEARFDEDGKQTESVFLIDGKAQTWWKYSYGVDRTGNWIRRVEKSFDENDVNGTVDYVTYRDIKYY